MHNIAEPDIIVLSIPDSVIVSDVCGMLIIVSICYRES